MADHNAPLAELIASLDTVEDPIQRYEDVVTVEARFDEELRGVRQRIAMQLYAGGRAKGGRTFAEVGQIMGGVTAQRAEQVAKGR
ncbi:hypothetical protein OHB04_02505 [Streptomyces sp. NBC_01775]|uniref:hypothetical protein n=1 Tax=Streptomyces sp. NBC_01775 TaxID=2975939 RepID=UPI002DD9A935|nr:hypothetical protein [Streptomyces sp. NBC_01775]WSB74765.1 hypothetical protein OHB04_02505 [Streptomyces sp. NBC_01775]